MSCTGRHILGVSAYYHDASAALLRDGEVLAAAAEERFTRQKHDANFPAHAIAFCLERAGIGADDLEAVAFYEQPHVKFTRVLASTLADFPRSCGAFTGAMKGWLTRKLWTQQEISRRLGIDPARVVLVPHHESHAAAALAMSGFEEAAIVVADAVGEWSCVSLASGRGGAVRVLESMDYPQSLGLFYAAMTAFLGFRPNDGECSTMALAAFGRPRYAGELRRVLRVGPDGGFHLDDRYFDFLSSGASLPRPALTELLGPARTFGDDLAFDALVDAGEGPAAGPDQQRWADLAASVQLVLEEAVLGLCRKARRMTGSRRLCLAGGIALNAVANSAVIAEAGFEEVFIPPDPGDGGAAIGAAARVHAQRGGGATARRMSPYQGEGCDTTIVRAILDRVDPAAWAAHLMPGARGIDRDELVVEHVSDDGAVAEMVADELSRGRIVGWVQDRGEVGPRALGNRSILADPGDMRAAVRLRTAVKSRAPFRPFALSVTDRDAGKVLELREPVPVAAHWMQMVARVRDEARSAVRAALHTDGTTRPQVVTPGDNPRFYRLLTALGRRRRYAAVLNTSLNEDGYPPASTAADALLVFARTDMDVLVIGDTVARKRRGSQK